jgi:hypothetical protein
MKEQDNEGRKRKGGRREAIKEHDQRFLLLEL